jgi:hypothetical protein
VTNAVIVNVTNASIVPRRRLTRARSPSAVPMVGTVAEACAKGILLSRFAEMSGTRERSIH